MKATICYQNMAMGMECEKIAKTMNGNHNPRFGLLTRAGSLQKDIQKAIKEAVGEARICKRASAHTFRHSFASHLLQANYDIRTISGIIGSQRRKNNNDLYAYRKKHHEKGSQEPT